MELEKLNVILKTFGINARCIHSKHKPEVTDMPGGWRAYPYRLAFQIFNDDGWTYRVMRCNAFGSLPELKARVNVVTRMIVEGRDPEG
jgi:hypothetical protein